MVEWYLRYNKGIMNVLTTLETVSSSAQRLFPNLSLEAVLAHLLLEHAQKNLIRYQSMIHQFEIKYGQKFERFRQQILTTTPDFETEQDYFDWEMAVTAAEDMKAEITRLKEIRSVP